MKPVKYKNVLHTHAHCRAIKSYCIFQLSFNYFLKIRKKKEYDRIKITPYLSHQ